MASVVLPSTDNSANGADSPGRYSRLYAEETEDLYLDEDGGGFDFREILAIFHRNRFLLAAIVVAAIVLGLVVTLLTTRQYEATASVQIEQSTATIVEDSAVEPNIPSSDTNRFLQTQSSILKSRALADQVRQSLSLDRDDAFITAMGADAPDATGKALATARKKQVLALLTNNLTVSVPLSSRVATITFKSPSPSWAARIANSYAANYIQANLDRRVDSSRYAREFLLRQIGDTKERLEASEQAALAYARNQGLIDTAADGASLPVSNMHDLNSAYSQARVKRLDAEQRWREAQSTPVMSLPEVIASPIIQSLLQQRSQQMITLDQLRARYLNGHPSVEQAQNTLNGINNEIARQAANIRASLRSEYLADRRQEESLNRDVSQLRSVALDEQSRRVRYNILKREVDTNRTLYDALLQRYKGIAAGAGLSISNVSMVDSAQVPGRPSEPNMVTNLLIAVLAGIGLGIVVVFIRERLDDVVRTPEEVQRKLGLPLLAAIPRAPADSSPQRELANTQSAVAEAYHTMRTAVEFSTPTGAPRSLLFTSSRPGEGKSTSAYATAQEFARLGRHVLLIDGDLRKPSLHNLLRLSSKVGLVNVLTGQRALSEASQASDVPGLDVITCGPLPPNPTELLASGALPRVLAEATRSYDMVVIDGPPGMGLADAQLLAREVEGVAFIVEAGFAHRGQAKTAIKRLLAANGHVIGVVLSKFDPRKAGYGYGYNYGYGYTYGQPYGQGAQDTATA